MTPGQTTSAGGFPFAAVTFKRKAVVFMSRGWTSGRVTRLAMLTALAVVGSFMKIPSITGTPALDAAPGYFAALSLGAADGSIVAGLGHLATAMTVGFPLGLPIHLLIALGMAGCAAAVGLLFRVAGPWVAGVAGWLLNGIALPALFILVPGFGPAFFSAMVVPLLVAGGINVGIALGVWAGVSRSGIVRSGAGGASPEQRVQKN